MQNSLHLRNRIATAGIETNPHIHRVGCSRKGAAVVGIAPLGVVVVVAAGSGERAGMYAAGGHVAVGLDAENRLGVDSQVVRTCAARTASVTMVVMGRGSQRRPRAIAGGKRVPVGGLCIIGTSVPRFKPVVGELVIVLSTERYGCQQRQPYC